MDVNFASAPACDLMGAGQVEQSEGLASSYRESTKDMKTSPKSLSGTQAPPLGFNYDIKLIP